MILYLLYDRIGGVCFFKMKEFEYIKSKENQTIKLISKLQTSSSARNENKKFVIEGLRLCKDAVINGFFVDTLVVTESAYNQFMDDVELISQKANRCILVDNELFVKISDTKTPQGVLCVCDSFEFEGGISQLRKGKFILLENLQDPSNLGAIARTAEALGIDGIIVDKNGCDPYSPKSQRAGMGALLRIPVFVSDSLCDDLKDLKNNGFKLFATVPKQNVLKVTDADFSKKCVVLIGNEGNGLSINTIKICDEVITIPMKGKAESLNAATAASIIMWEMVK